LGNKRRSYSIENIVQAKFKEILWWVKELEDKIELRYYKEVVNPNFENKKYLFVLTTIKKKINIVKIRSNSHELHSDIIIINNSICYPN
jgi:hypothetical protein